MDFIGVYANIAEVEPEDKKLLEETYQLSQENNKLLKSLHRSMKVRRYISIIYWVFIIGSAIGAYYFVEPYVGGIKDSYSRAQNDISSLQEFFKNLKN